MPEETLRILIADDDEGDRRLTIRALKQSGLAVECTETASIAEALEACDRQSFECAVDYQIPGEDGLNGVKLLHDRLPAMVILMVTGHGDVMVATEAMKRGASDFMPKGSITGESIKRAITNALEKARLQRMVAEQNEKLIRMEADRHAAELEKELERAAEADQAKTRELQQRDDFLSHVSHELRSPLSSIAAFTGIIVDGLAGATTEEQMQYLAIIQKNARQLEAMIEDLLTVRASQTGKLQVELQSASLGQAVRDAVQTCESKAKAKGVTLRASISDGLAEVYGDPVRLVQVLIILCDNGVKFTAAGGSVTVRAFCRDEEPEFVIAEVADTGCGIPPEQAAKVFEHLYQATNNDRAGRTGLGLGLHIARELVAQQGGRIWVESEVGVGSRFCFTVPVFAGQSAAVTEARLTK